MTENLSVAFCIFGQLRDDHIHLPAIAKLAAEFDASVFISTWRRRGTKTSGIINRDQIVRMFGYEFGSAMPAQMVGDSRFNEAVPDYEATVLEAFAGNTVTKDYLVQQIPGAVVDIEDETLHLDFPHPPPSDRNSLRMLYKVWRCNELKRVAERQRGKVFDVVVRFRPDVLPKLDRALLASLCSSEGSRTVLFHGGKPGATYLGDVITASCSPLADQMATLFGVAMRHPHRKWDNIHLEIPRHMSELGIVAGHIDLSHWVTEDFARSQPRNREHVLKLLDANRVNPATFPNPTTWPAVRQLLHAAAAVEERRGRYAIELRLSRIDLEKEDSELAGRAAFLLARASEQAKEPALMLAAQMLEMLCRVDARGDDALRNKALPNELLGIVNLAARLGISEPITWRALERMLAPSFGAHALRRLTIAARSLTPGPRRLAAERRIAQVLRDQSSIPSELADGLAKVQEQVAGGQGQSALPMLRALSEAFPSCYQPAAGLGDLLLGLGNAKEALEAYRSAAAAADARADLHGMVSFCCQRLGDVNGAIEATRAACAKAPINALYTSRLAVLLSEHGRHAEAEQAWRDAAAQAPADHWVLQGLARCLVEIEKRDEALTVLAAALALAPDDAEIKAAQAKLLGPKPKPTIVPPAEAQPAPHLRTVPAPAPTAQDDMSAEIPLIDVKASMAWQVLLGKASPPPAPATPPPAPQSLLRRLLGRRQDPG